MASVNKVILVGNLGNDPEVRYMPGGGAVATLSIATNERWKNKTTGAPEERTEWHRVIFFGKQAELCRDYLKKGSPLYIEGRLQTRKWQDKEGQTKYTTEIVGQTMQFLGSGAGRDKGMDAPSDMGSDMGSAPAGGPPPFNAEEDIPF